MDNTTDGYIKLNEVKNVLSKLKEDTNEINLIYERDLKNVLESNKKCLKVSGLNSEEIDNLYKNTISELKNNMDNLTYFLEKNIIEKYELINIE